MTEKRSPWFNARRQPPVNGGHASEYEWKCDRVPNGGDGARYEHRCFSHRHGEDWRKPDWLCKESILKLNCFDCQWRGLLREDGEVLHKRTHK